MDEFGNIPVAIAAIFVGAGLLLLAWGLARWLASRPARANAAAVIRPPVGVQIGSRDDAVLVARAGGRVLFANELARQWFGLDGGDPDLMLMARQARPPDSFLELFAAEGQATLEVRTTGPVVTSRRVEAASYRLPWLHERQGKLADDGLRFVVVLRDTGYLPRLTPEDERIAVAMSAIAEFSQTMSATLDFEATLDAILASVARVIRYDVGEINLWEADNNCLRNHRRQGNRDYTPAMGLPGDVYRLDEGYAGWIARHRRPLYIPDVSQRQDIPPRENRDNFDFSAYLGVPLRSGDNLVGTLELFSIVPNGFDPTHLRILDTISWQAAIAVLNAQHFEVQRRRVGELSGLAEVVAQVDSSLTDSPELYARLGERIARLMRVNLCGFLLYDEQAGALVGQLPFYGVPDALVALYRIPLPRGSRVNRIWLEADHWLSNDALTDPVLDEVGLTDMASSMGIRQTLVVPLVTGGRRLGIVQVANKPPGEAFDETDARQLSVLSGHAAALIDNARLVRETRIRAQRAEGLRRIAAIAGSAQLLDDTLRLAVEETVRLLGADVAVILLLHDARGELIPQAASAFGIPNEFLGRPFLTMTDPFFRASVAHTRRPFLTNSAQAQLGALGDPNYRRLIQQLHLDSFVNAPLVIQERGIGELAVGARRPNAFSPTDLELLLTIGSQVASAIERARLAEATDENLYRRVEQLTALARISRQLSQTLQLDRILTTVCEEAVGRATTADYASIVLLNVLGPGGADLPSAPESGLPRVMKRVGSLARAAGGEEAEPREAAGLSRAEAAIVEGGLSSVRPAARDPRADPSDLLAGDAASALIVPIVYKENIVGLIHLQSRTPNSFDQTAADFAQAMADQTAVAIGNAHRYEEQLTRSALLRRRADQLSQLFQISRSVRSDHPPAQNLEAIAFGVQEAIGFDVVIMDLLNPVSRQLEPAAAAGLPLATFERIKKVTQPWTEIEPLLRDEFRISQSYYIPRRQRLTTGPLPSAAQPAPRPDPELWGRAWQRDDLLLVPFVGSSGDVLGLMQLDQPRNGKPPDRFTIETLEIFANQAVLAIESARLYQTAEERAAELARRLADLSASYKELDEVSRSLVQKDQELTRLVDELDLRTRRLLSLNHVTEALPSTRDPQALLRIVAEAIAGEMQMEACLIALRVHGLPQAGVDQSPLRIAAAAGLAVPPGADLSHLLPLNAEANPISYSLERHLPLLVRDVERSGWEDSPLVIGLGLRAFVSVPILLRGSTAGALFVASQKALVSFADQDLDLFTILANQIGMSLENAELYAETQRRLYEQTLLYEMSQDLMLAHDAPSAIAQRLGRAFNSELCLFSEYDAAKTVTVRAAYAPASSEAGRAPPAVGLCYPLDDYPAARLLAWRDGAVRRRSPLILYADEPDAQTGATSFLCDRGYAVLVAAPMLSGDRVVGLIELYGAQRRDFTPDEIRLLEALANQASVAYESVRLEAAVRERARQLEALAEVSHAISSTLHADELIAVVLERLADVIAYDQACLWIAEGTQLKLAAVRGYEDDTERMGPSGEIGASPLLDELAATGRVLVVPDVLADPRFAQVVGGMRRTRSWMGVPLMSKGELLGALALAKVQAGYYGSLHGELALAFANQVAASLDNARLYQQARQFTQQLERTVAERTGALQFERDRVETLQRITSELSTSLDLDRVLQRALTLVSDVVAASEGSIFLIDPQSDRLIYRAALGRAQPLPSGGQPSPFARHEGLVGWVLRQRQAVVIGDLEADPRWIPDVAGRQHRSALAAPLITSDDVLGAIMFFGREPNAFNEDQLSLVSAAAAQVASAINNAELYRLIRDQAERLGALLRAQQVEASKTRAILESIADGVMVADDQGRIVLFNAAAARILDLPRDIVGQPAAAFVGHYGAVGKSWSSAVARWTADPGSYVPGDYLAERFELEDKRVVSVHLAPVTSGDDYLGSVSLFRDITRDVEVDRLKTEFVTTVSHELRTPLTPIKGYVDALLLGMAGPVDEQQRQILAVIKSNIDRLATLVHDLLDISRIESGKVELELQPVPIGEVIDEVVTGLRGRVDKEGKPLTLVVQAPAGLSPILADRARIVQVLTNLAYNAFSYTPAGGTITFSAREESGVMEVSVRDTGTGIAPENLQRIFERFYRREDALVLTTAGTGLGLPIVRSLVEMHNGRLWAESAGAGKGSTFTFLMPLARQGEMAEG